MLQHCPLPGESTYCLTIPLSTKQMKSNTLYHNPIGWLGNNLMFFLLFDRSLEFIPKYMWVIPLQTAEPEIQEQMCELNFNWCHSLTHITLGYFPSQLLSLEV